MWRTPNPNRHVGVIFAWVAQSAFACWPLLCLGLSGRGGTLEWAHLAWSVDVVSALYRLGQPHTSNRATLGVE